MANRTPEQDLINDFVQHLRTHQDPEIRIELLLNSNCKSKRLADVEFKSAKGLHWVIEAKSDDSKDKHNTVHKIFGELLKETGRTNRADCRHAVLIPESAVDFYSRAFQSIAREKFLGFGRLIPVDTVFLSGPSGTTQLTWAGLYDAFQVPVGRKHVAGAPKSLNTNARVSIPEPSISGNR
jgi:hypothetical protein